MPITKRFEVNKYLEDFEEINELAPFSNPNFLEEEEMLQDDKIIPTIPLWKKWWNNLTSFFSKI
jgi:hypothetical protein